ncbi:MAG: T9SS type A sorting domain-containing protein [Candidatus Symbiothrix sp.]|jgi:hypothetical protein|nr:T9SS type A sorting domain-containing protein [Candidatus Symbiothrix sp.]
MKTIKNLLIVAGVFLFCHFAFAQTITFGYDTAGNRINRVIEVQLRSGETDEEPPKEYAEALAEMVIKIYPNPTEGLLHVSIENMPEGVTAQIALYQLNGNLIITQKGIQNFTELNISNQPAGVYLLRIIAGDEHTEWKIIKK